MSQSDGNEDSAIPASAKPSPDEPSLTTANPLSKAGEAALEDSRGLPKSFGRHRVVEMLGKGGFGAVYRAVDDQLQRHVAIKVTLGSLLDPALRESFLTEARIVAALDHPNIVPVYDVGQSGTGDFFVVSKLIDGSDLASRIKFDRPDRLLSLRIIEQIADALHYAHTKGLVHRDVKPANILLDRNNRPYLADFGIALRETERRREGDSAGTPAYMSPEQARGEGHRIDNRSDIYSLGVVLYELLTGRRPFRTDTLSDLMTLIATEEVRSPRLFEETISPDLERICLKALARRASDRFTVARDLADEIRWLLAQQAPTPGLRPSVAAQPAGTTPVTPLTPNTAELAVRASDATPTGPTRIVPKGLRSFDASDASFFLELLPGPFDREGLPEGLRFWKTRIEETDPEKTFKVGLVYGPSGCGKSSLMKAGLLPRLSPKIIPIYLEATPEDTETRLVRAIRKAIPDAEGGSLKEILSVIRRRKLVPTGGKLLLVLDQFEQWLFAEKNYAKAPLTEALLQCDGGTVQAMVMVREDFWVSVSRFLRELEVSIEKSNSAMVDLFDMEHAAKVLGLFGKAYGKLPDRTKDWSAEQIEFVQKAIEGLSQDRKVISVQIAVFADMMKSREWTPAALREVGGIEGVGTTFLEEMFGSRHAPIQHRQHQEAVRGLLSALLPSFGSDIKGAMQSAAMLQQAAGYERKPREFQELMGILDGDLRLITPVDASMKTDAKNTESEEIESQEASKSSRSYQLAHDYMVPSLRDWLTQKQRETKKGRAELKLAERAAIWSVNQENKQLPTLVEWLQIRRWTERAKWKPAERSVMRTAARVHARFWGSSILVVALVVGVIGSLFQQQHVRSQKEKIAVALDSLQSLGPSVPVNIKKLLEMKQPDLIRQELNARYVAATESREMLSVAFALAHFGQVETDFLISQIDDIEDRDKANLVAALANDHLRSLDKLKQAASECRRQDDWKRKSRLAICALGIGDTTLPIDTCEFEGRTDHGPRTWFIEEFPSWELDLGAILGTVANSDSPALRSAVCLGIGRNLAYKFSADHNRMAQVATKWFSLPDSSTHSAVAWLMREWQIPEPKLKDATEIIEGRNWFVNSQGATFIRITPKPIALKPLPDPVAAFRQRLREIDSMPFEERNQVKSRDARGESLFQTGQYEAALLEFDALLTGDQDDELEKRRKRIVESRLLSLARLNRADDADSALEEWRGSEPDPDSIDYVESLVLLWLGRKEESVARFEKGREKVISNSHLYNLACIAALFASNESPTSTGRRMWIDLAMDLLERWSDDRGETRSKMRDDPDLLSLHGEPRFFKLAAEGTRVPEQSYWLASKEVTRGEYEVFLKNSSNAVQISALSPTRDHPASLVSWLDAVMYCNWLSRQEGREPAYRSGGKKKKKYYDGREVEIDKWELDEGTNGYRLPRELEWEYACRAGTMTDWSPGNEKALLGAYCQMYPSERTAKCGGKLPNAWGFHDMHGNVNEFCQELYDIGLESRVIRGGGWGDLASSCTSAYRNGVQPEYLHQGFRLALVPVAEAKLEKKED